MALAIEQSQRLLGMAREGFGASGSDAQVCLGDRRLNPGHRFERYEPLIEVGGDGSPKEPRPRQTPMMRDKRAHR
ncbi:hypothetical protein AnigIFM59636_006111 [Aspergillus niger]|nr:hypothetical protein AnigIFM59636_006111 [Aspergillus niger]